jgi:hypothetical protein
MYFGVERKTVLRALDELSVMGFFALTRIERFKPNVYDVVDHKTWANRFPGRCVQKMSFPWEGQEDLLGQQLFAMSGQRVVFLPNQITGLRTLGFSDEQISDAFRTFLEEADYEGKRWKHAYYDFRESLKGMRPADSPVRLSAVANCAPDSSTEYHGRDSSGVPPKVLDRVPSESCTEYHGRDASSRYESLNGKGEGRVSIPRPASQGRATVASSQPKVQGRGFPPSKPSPINTAPARRMIR